MGWEAQRQASSSSSSSLSSSLPSPLFFCWHIEAASQMFKASLQAAARPRLALSFLRLQSTDFTRLFFKVLFCVYVWVPMESPWSTVTGSHELSVVGAGSSGRAISNHWIIYPASDFIILRYVYVLCMCICMHACVFLCLCLCVCLYVSACVCVYLCMYVSICVCVRVFLHVSVCVTMSVCLYVPVCDHVCLC